jgi:hypothetical protein
MLRLVKIEALLDLIRIESNEWEATDSSGAPVSLPKGMTNSDYVELNMTSGKTGSYER